jgi:iron complex outermembrane receptor protein
MQAIKKVALGALLSSTVLGATTAFAAEPAAAAPEDGSAIIVTGTRTTGLKAGDSPAPVQVLSSDLMARAGRSDINTALALGAQHPDPDLRQ